MWRLFVKIWLLVLSITLLFGCQSNGRKNVFGGWKSYHLSTTCDVYVHNQKKVPVADYLTCNANQPINLDNCMADYGWQIEARSGEQCNVMAYTNKQIRECSRYATIGEMMNNALLTQCLAKYQPTMTTDAKEPSKNLPEIFDR